MPMSSRKVYDITLQLSEIGHLFERPNLSPLSEQYQPYSHEPALEFIADELYANPSFQSVKATILLPESKFKPDLLESTRQAIRIYTQARLREARDNVRGLRWRGSRGFVRGGILLLILGGAAKWLTFAQEVPIQVASEGLLIAGTLVFEMAIWDYFIHSWQQKLDESIYQKLINMELIIKPTKKETTHGE